MNEYTKADFEKMFGTGGAVGEIIDPYLAKTQFGRDTREAWVLTDKSVGIPLSIAILGSAGETNRIGEDMVVVNEKSPWSDLWSIGQVHYTRIIGFKE